MSAPENDRETPRALVSGGSRGIGAAICRRLARAGAHVLVAARNVAGCDEVVAEIVAAGGSAEAVAFDVGDPAAIRSAARGRVDWLVNNAGIAVSGPLLARGDDPDEPYELHMRINFHGARRLTEAALPGMKERGHGRVVNVASSAALRGYAYVAAYCASKHALLGYTLAAADELAKTGVTVNAVCPHYVDSPMLAASIERVVEKTGKSKDEARAFFRDVNPGKRLVTMDEVAEAVFALLADDAAPNGRVVELDGSPEPTILQPNEVR